MGLLDKIKTRRGVTILAWSVLSPLIFVLVIVLPMINKTFELVAFILSTFLCKINKYQ